MRVCVHNKTSGEPEDSRLTKSRHICIRTCVQSTHVYIYAGQQDEIRTNYSFSLNMSFLPKKKRKRCERNTKTSSPNGCSLRTPSTKSTKTTS